MDLHHGEIHVFSKGEGTSSTFTVDLPMTRKIDPLVVVNNRPRRFTRERLVGLFGGQINRHHPTSPSALLPAPQVANNQAVLNSLQPMNKHSFSPVVDDDPVSLSNHSKGARFEPNLPIQISQSNLPVKSDHSSGARIEPKHPNVDEVKSVLSVMSMGRQSLHDLAEHDRMLTNAARQAKASSLLLKQSIDHRSLPIRNPERGGVSTGGGPTMSAPQPRHFRNDDAVGVLVSDDAADPPSQQLRPASMTMATSSPSPAPSSTTPVSLSAAPSRKSQLQSQNKQLPQGPVYHVLVVDDSTMTRKMLMKTLRNGGIIHSINAS